MCAPTCALSSLGPAGFFVLHISILLSAALSAAMDERKCCRVQQDQSDTAKILLLLWVWTIKLKKPAVCHKKNWKKERGSEREREGFLSMHIQHFNLAPEFVDTENPIIVFYANHLKRFWKPWTHRTPLHLFRKSSGSLRPLMKILQKTGGGQNYL